MLVNKTELIEFIHLLQRMDGLTLEKYYNHNSSIYSLPKDDKHFKHVMYLYKTIKIRFFNCKGDVQILSKRNKQGIIIPQKEIKQTIAEIFATKGHPQL